VLGTIISETDSDSDDIYIPQKLAAPPQRSSTSRTKKICWKTLSTYARSKPEGDSKRLLQKENISKLMPCPLMLYSYCLREVDLLVSMLGYYRLYIRSKKCT
jgi:hypothetical protein